MQAALSWKQTKTFTLASIRSRYRNTFAGFVWVVCGPLIIYGVQAYVFSSILNLKYENYLLFLLSGLLPWIFFQQSISMTTTLISNQARLLKSFPIHPLTFLSAVILDNLVNFLFTFTLILSFVLLVSAETSAFHLFIVLPALFSLFIATVALCWCFSVLQVFFYDTKFILDFSLNILFFLTPIFYPLHMVPEGLRWIVEVNPVASLLAPFQALTQPMSTEDLWLLVVKSLLVSSVLFAGASLFWKNAKNSLYFKL